MDTAARMHGWKYLGILPSAIVPPIVINPGQHRSDFAPSPRGPTTQERTFESVHCAEGELFGSWIDAPPGPLLPAQGGILHIDELASVPGRVPVAHDDDRSVETLALGRVRRGYRRSVRWCPDHQLSGSYHVVLEEGRRRDKLFPAIASDRVSCISL